MESNVLYVLSHERFEVGCELIINPLGGREENNVIAELKDDGVIVLEEAVDFPHIVGEIVEQVPGGPVASKNMRATPGKDQSTVFKTHKSSMAFWLKAMLIAFGVAVACWLVAAFLFK